MVRRHRLLVPVEAPKLPAAGYPLPAAEAPPKALRRRARTALSRVTTGKEILPGIDWRTATARRYQDIVARIAADQGGADRLSEVRLQLVRRYAGGAVLAEAMEAKLAKGEPIDISQYALLASSLVRIANRIGIDRRARSVAPALKDYIEGVAVSDDDAQDE